MPTYGWGANEPVIEPIVDGGDTIATFSQKVYNLFDDLFDTLNSYPWSVATQSDAGYMSAEDKETLDDVASTYLTLSGGTLSGNLKFSASSAYIEKTTDSGVLAIYSGSAINKGSELVMYGKDHSSYPGEFSLRAKDGVNSVTLRGCPDGTLTWDTKEVERVSTTVTSGNHKFIRYESGVEIAIGPCQSSSSPPVAVNFASSFTNTPRVVLTSRSTTITVVTGKMESVTTTGFDFYAVTNNGYVNGANFHYIAIALP